MAVIIGNSGAWAGVLKKLKRLDLYAQAPDEIPGLLERLRKEFEPAISSKRSETENRVTEIRTKISDLRLERGFVKVVLGWIKMVGQYFAIFKVRREQQLFVSRLSYQLYGIEQLSASPELIGASAELAVIDELKRLPADHVVINDVQLKSRRYIRFDGKPLQSAQIDHLILSPAGVFVVETKCWSKGFAAHGNYHNPFDQVRRASYLCHVVMKDSFGSIKVRSIIACVGHLMANNKEKDYVKILRINELNGYIAWFKKEEISPDRLSRLSQFFSEGCKSR